MDHCPKHEKSHPFCCACIVAKREHNKPSAADLDSVADEQAAKEATGKIRELHT